MNEIEKKIERIIDTIIDLSSYGKPPMYVDTLKERSIAKIMEILKEEIEKTR